MATANEVLSDNAIYHALYLLRYGNGLEPQFLKALQSLQKTIEDRLARRLILIEERGLDIGPATTRRLNEIIAEIRDLIDNVYSRSHDDLVSKLGDLASVEAAFQAASFTQALPGLDIRLPAPARLKAIVTERPFNGALLKQWTDGLAKGAGDRIERAIRDGMSEGASVDDIVRAIRGTKAGAYRDGVAEVSRRSARALVRTSITHVNNAAAQETWRANERLLKGWQFIATLDSRTTLTCAALDGQIFPIGEGPVPPRHVQCRSITCAVTKSWSELGAKDRKDADPKLRASMDGNVAGTTTFDGFLKPKSVEFQDALLGVTRAKLHRAGKLNLRDFINDRGVVIDLKTLESLHPKAFR